MSEIAIAVSLAGGLGLLIVWMLLEGRRSANTVRSAADLNLKESLPRNYQYYPQIRQALSQADRSYLRASAPPGIAQQALRERTAIARRFMDGLLEDFNNLERLGRMVAALSPVISREHETDRLLLSLQFHLFYRLVRLRLLTGRVPLDQIGHLTELVGRLTSRIELSISAIAALSTQGISSEYSS